MSALLLLSLLEPNVICNIATTMLCGLFVCVCVCVCVLQSDVV